MNSLPRRARVVLVTTYRDPECLPEPARESGTVLRVVDANTLVVRTTSGTRQRVSLLGVAAPRGRCGGRATRAARRLLPRGSTVDLLHANTDPGGRGDRVRFVLARGADVARVLLRSGHLTTSAAASRKAAVYRAAQRSARRHHRGVWAPEC